MSRSSTFVILNSSESGPASLPPPPPREVVCGVRTHFQGIVYQTREFGRICGFAPELLADDDRPLARAAHRAVGDRHLTFNLTGAYREPRVIYPERLRNGHDWTHDLPGIKARIREAVVDGFCVDFSLGGDGRSQPKQSNGSYTYNDPVGDTYGYEWLMDNLARIVKAIRGDADSEAPGEDLTPWTLFRPGYDAVFYGWGDGPAEPDCQPQRVIDFGALFRKIHPTGYLYIEHTPGNIPLGEGGYDWAPGPFDPSKGREAYGMRHFDTIGAEFVNWPDRDDTIWQVAGRMLNPYHRPAEQPSADDPHPPFLLAAGTPRGPWCAVAYEYGKYPESHGAFGSADDVQNGRDSIVRVGNEARAYYQALGYQYWG